MSSPENVRHNIEEMKAAWVKAQPLAAANGDLLWRKLRLEWNYNSNHIEGNTLTYGETELLLIFGQTAGDHTMREYEEMKSHDVAIEHIRQLAQAEQLISEADIRSLNHLILKESFWKPAITADGSETRKQVTPGEYKTSPNNVRTVTGEIFQFADPLDTPSKMQQLVSWLQARLTARDIPIPELISKLHHDFVLIHPFDDGNGRVARLLVNYVLLREGFPPVIIKSRDKANYLAAIRKADVGDLAAFTTYLANEMIWSLNLGLRAARGESIEEPDDLDKEIAVFAKQYKTGTKLAVCSSETLQQAAEHSWIPLIKTLGEKLVPLARLFHSHTLLVAQKRKISGSWSIKHVEPTEWNGEWQSENISWQDILRKFGILSKGGFWLPQQFQVEFSLGGFANVPAPFDVKVTLLIDLENYYYLLSSANTKLPDDKFRYDRPLAREEICHIANAIARTALEQTRRLSEK